MGAALSWSQASGWRPSPQPPSRRFCPAHGELIERFAELNAILGVTEPQFQSVLRHSAAACGGMDVDGFERVHQFLEALAFLAAQQAPGL